MKKVRITIILALLVSVSIVFPASVSAADSWPRNATPDESRYVIPHEASGFGSSNAGPNRVSSGGPTGTALGNRTTTDPLQDSVYFLLMLGIGYAFIKGAGWRAFRKQLKYLHHAKNE
jgi:hypothetical protein